MVACGNNPSNTANSNTQSRSQSTQEENSKEDSENKDNDNADSNKITEGYYFEISGVKIIPDMEAKELLDALGEPISYFEANSCAFGEQDTVWTYAGFMIDTYRVEGVDYIYDVILTDDTVETPEGIYLGKTKEDVTKAYGTPGEETDTQMIYKKGDMKLIFILKEGKVISIEYDSMILDKQ